MSRPDYGDLEINVISGTRDERFKCTSTYPLYGDFSNFFQRVQM